LRRLMVVSMVLLCCGCSPIKSIFGGPEVEVVMDWTNLHRIGPNTKSRVYRWDDERKKWVLMDKEVTIPEGWYISQPPSNDPTEIGSKVED